MAGYFFGCPHCRAKLEARDASRAGRTVTCPKCEQALIIPPPPRMGVPLSQADGNPLAAVDDDASGQVVVSHDPGFKRPMSPAKAFGEASDALPAPSHSGYEKLPPAEALQEPEAHTLAASEDVEGYSFTVPDNHSDVAPPPAFVFKPKKKRVEEAPHPLENPKNQLALLLAIVTVLAGITGLWSWLSRSNEKNKPKPVEATTSDVPLGLPKPPNQAQPTEAPGLPGAAPTPVEPAQPVDPNALPGAAPPAPAPTPEPATLPGAVPNVLPDADTESPPGTAPRPLPESTPNVLPGTTP